jgi:hypothetical protein
MMKIQVPAKVQGKMSPYIPSPRARLIASNRFYQVISLWEAIALHGNGKVPTITETLRGNAISWRDQTWPRRLASVAVTVTIGMHLLGGYPKRYIEELIEEELGRRGQVVGNGSYVTTENENATA